MKEFLLVVGPEGGFDKDEIDQALQAGFLSVSLGKRVLRVDTAAAGRPCHPPVREGRPRRHREGRSAWRISGSAVSGGRLLAYLIDKFILYLVSLILFLIGLIALGLGGVSFGSIVMTGDLPRGMGLFMAVYVVTTLLTGMIYFIWFHGTVGQTPGKMLFGLRVIQISGEKMTLGVAFLRWVGSLVSGLVFFLGFLWIAFDGRKQGWHDKIAATLVIRVGNEPDAGDARPELPSQPFIS